MFEFYQVAQYFHAKEACYICTNPNDIVDTSVQIEGEGVLALCRTCLKQLGLVAGADPEDEAQIETLAALTGRLETDLRAEKQLTRKLRKELRDLRTEEVSA